jgi:hypothetical protein
VTSTPLTCPSRREADRSLAWQRRSMSEAGTVSAGASSAATSKIPPAMLTLYVQAASICPGLPWTIPAAIGTVESDNGQFDLPGVRSGTNSAGAEGPMQFEPATFS